jgi:hypothetical protein
MQNRIVLDGHAIPIIGAVSLSTGDGLELSQRFSYDYSKRPQSIVFRKRNTALTATIQQSFTNSMCIDNGFLHIFDYIDTIQSAVGELVGVYWQNKLISNFIIVSAQISASIDAQSIIPAASISLSLIEGFVRRETLYTAVKTL